MTRWAYEVSVQATLRDTDGLGHVNNAVYVSWFEVVRTSYVLARRGFTRIEECDFVLAATTVNFRAPVYFPEHVILRCVPTTVGGSSWGLAYEGRAQSDGRLVVDGTSVQVQYDYQAKGKKAIAPTWRRMLLEDGGSE